LFAAFHAFIQRAESKHERIGCPQIRIWEASGEAIELAAGKVMGWVSVFAAVVIMAIGSALQAAAGVGLALLVVPLLALIDSTYVPGPMLMAGAVLAGMTAWRERHAVDRVGICLSLGGLLIGTVLGAVALRALQGPVLPKVFGILVLLAVILSIFGPPLKATARSLSVAGGAAGIMGTMVGIHGPPIALVFQNAEPAVARAMLGAFFMVAYLGSVVALFVVGLFGWSELVRAAILLPGVGLGLVVAPFIAPLVNRSRLKWTILAVSAVSALALLTR
jgi:uncharacterized protein